MEKERKKIKLVDICEISKGSQLNRTDMVDDVKYYVQNGGIDISGYTNEYNTEENTISISEGGNSCGYVNYNKEKFWAGGHCYRLINIVDGVYVKYLYHVLKYKQNDIMNLRVGSGLPNIQKKDIEKLKFYLPDFKIQKRIGDLLDLVDEIIEKYDVLLQEYQQLVKSQFVEMFGNKNFEKVELKSVSEVKGRVGWKGYTKADLRDSGPLVLGATHLSDDGLIDLSEPVFLSREKYEESPEIMIEKNDIIFAQRGSLGKIGLVKDDLGDATINPCVLILRPHNINPEFFRYLLIMEYDSGNLARLNSGSTIPMISQKTIGEFKIILPDQNLQNKFAEFVKVIDKLKFALEKQKENYVNLKKGLMQQLLTGKIEINI